MYFGRNSYDPNATREAQQRAAQFSGASAISSNQFFGIEEEERETDQGLLGAESLGDLGNQAGKIAARIMEQTGMGKIEDVQDALRTGALKVSKCSVTLSCQVLI